MTRTLAGVAVAVLHATSACGGESAEDRAQDKGLASSYDKALAPIACSE